MTEDDFMKLSWEEIIWIIVAACLNEPKEDDED